MVSTHPCSAELLLSATLLACQKLISCVTFRYAAHDSNTAPVTLTKPANMQCLKRCYQYQWLSSMRAEFEEAPGYHNDGLHQPHSCSHVAATSLASRSQTEQGMLDKHPAGSPSTHCFAFPISTQVLKSLGSSRVNRLEICTTLSTCTASPPAASCYSSGPVSQ